MKKDIFIVSSGLMVIRNFISLFLRNKLRKNILKGSYILP